jgi:hypothetical protein
MSGSIRKIQSNVALPLTPAQNILTFDIPQDQGVIDMSSSYVSLEIGLNGLSTQEDYHNITLGQDGFQYSESCLFRNTQLREGGTSNVLSEVNFCNIIAQNLHYVGEGHERRKALATVNGSGHAQSSDGSVVSIFNNQYNDPVPVLKVSLEDLFLGTLGNSDAVPTFGDLAMRFLLENKYKCFQRTVPTGVYNLPEPSYTGPLPCADVAAGVQILIPTNGASLANVEVGNIVYVSFVIGTNTTLILANVTDVVPNTNITIDNVLSGTDLATNVSINVLKNNAKIPVFPAPQTVSVNLNGVNTNVSVIPLRIGVNAGGNYQYGVKQDVYKPTALNKGTVLKVSYKTVNSAFAFSEYTEILTSVYDLTTTGNNNQYIDTITLTSLLPTPPAGRIYADILIEPLYTNLLTDYSISGAHLVVYRRNIPFAKPKSMLLTQYKSQQIAMVSGLQKFQYTFQVDNNVYNAYFLTPSETNMLSVSHQKLSQYQYFVNGVALTTIPMPLNSSFHYDNLTRTFLNSEIYKPVNIAPYRDTEIITNIRPICIPAKLFNSIDTKGNLNVQQPGMKSLRVEVDTLDGETTPTLNTYMVLECYTDVPL